MDYDDGKKTDIWHCPKAYQENEKFLGTEAGPVLGRQRVLIAWHGEEKEIFAHEERELTVYRTPGGRLVFHLFGVLGEFERDLIQERARAGLAAGCRA